MENDTTITLTDDKIAEITRDIKAKNRIITTSNIIDNTDKPLLSIMDHPTFAVKYHYGHIDANGVDVHYLIEYYK